MKKLILSTIMGVASALSMQAQCEINYSRIVEDGGTGNYKAIMEEVKGFDAHTVFVPQDLSKFNTKNPLPVLVHPRPAGFLHASPQQQQWLYHPQKANSRFPYCPA